MHVCKWFAQLLAETITNVNLKSYMFTVLVLKRTELHSFYIFFFFFLYVLIWAAESPQIHTAYDYNYIDCCLTLIESEYFLMLVKK